MKIKKFLSSVLEFLRFTNHQKKNRKFKNIEVGKAIIVKEVLSDSPLIRIGYTKEIYKDHLVIYVPSIDCNCLVKFDGTNYYISEYLRE